MVFLSLYGAHVEEVFHLTFSCNVSSWYSVSLCRRLQEAHTYFFQVVISLYTTKLPRMING